MTHPQEPEEIARSLSEAQRRMDRDRFRLIQFGAPQAWAEGPDALKIILDYARVYSQDAPVKIERRLNGKWHKFDLNLAPAASSARSPCS